MQCIVHIDLDCFYAQVEAVRQGIDCRTTPYATVQWNNFIAVNYPARDRGVQRFKDNPATAREKCPELLTSHVATFSRGEASYSYHPSPRIATHKVALEPYREASRKIFAILRSEGGVMVGKAGIDEAFLDVTEAARRELEVMRAAHPETAAPLDPVANVLEHSTKLIEDRREEMEKWFAERGSSLEAAYDGPMRQLKRGVVHGGCSGSRAFSVSSGCTPEEAVEQYENSLLLCAASHVVKRLRQRVYDELHYDCSAGIAHNRLLAKCISATHKPNQQTLLLPDRASSALFGLQFERLRGFGGKFGQAVREVCGGAELCSEAWLVPLPQLYQLSVAAPAEEDDAPDETTRQTLLVADGTHPSRASCASTAGKEPVGVSVFYSLRGFGGASVSDPALPRSIGSSKVFYEAETSWRAVADWIGALVAEILFRFDDYAHKFRVEQLSLGARVALRKGVGLPDEVARRTRRQRVAIDGHALSAELLHAQGTLLMRQLMEEGCQEVRRSSEPMSDDSALPLSWAELTLSGFEPLATNSEDTASGSTLHQPTLSAMFAKAAAVQREKPDDVEVVEDVLHEGTHDKAPPAVAAHSVAPKRPSERSTLMHFFGPSSKSAVPSSKKPRMEDHAGPLNVSESACDASFVDVDATGSESDGEVE